MKLSASLIKNHSASLCLNTGQHVLALKAVTHFTCFASTRELIMLVVTVSFTAFLFLLLLQAHINLDIKYALPHTKLLEELSDSKQGVRWKKEEGCWKFRTCWPNLTHLFYISLVLSLSAFSEFVSVTSDCYWTGNHFPLQPFIYVKCWGGQAMTAKVVRCY